MINKSNDYKVENIICKIVTAQPKDELLKLLALLHHIACDKDSDAKQSIKAIKFFHLHTPWQELEKLETIEKAKE